MNDTYDCSALEAVVASGPVSDILSLEALILYMWISAHIRHLARALKSKIPVVMLGGMHGARAQQYSIF